MGNILYRLPQQAVNILDRAEENLFDENEIHLVKL